MNWIETLARDGRAATTRRERAHSEMRWSQQATPLMTARLVQQLKVDADAANAQLSLGLKVHLDASRLQIVHDSFPAFFLQIDVPARGLMASLPEFTVTITGKRTGSAPDQDRSREIIVKCKGVDECYYALDGVDFASASEVSRALLEPLIREVLTT